LGELEDTGWVHHDKMTTIYTHNWVNGEHKHCSNVNWSYWNRCKRRSDNRLLTARLTFARSSSVVPFTIRAAASRAGCAP
jgi:hypothetical protein